MTAAQVVLFATQAPSCTALGTHGFGAPLPQVAYDESLDKDMTLLSGGGDFGFSSIDPTMLPFDKNCNRVYPHTHVRVNNIFEVRTGVLHPSVYFGVRCKDIQLEQFKRTGRHGCWLATVGR